MTSWIKTYAYTKNQKRSYPEGRIRINNSYGENGVWSLEENFVHGYFSRNYLSGVNDININGNITRGERIYSPAIYSEYEGIIAYEHKIIKNKDKKISGLDIRPFVGHRSRVYNSTFDNRDQDIMLGGLGLDIEFASILDLEMIYEYEKVDTPNKEELILYDETVSYKDINGDRDIKRNAALLANVDRSSKRHTIEINPSLKLTKDWQFYAGYRRTITAYKSTNILDVDHYNNTPHRERFRTGMSYDFSKALSTNVELNRTCDYDDEDGDFTENNILFTLTYNFI
jgi:hypothetical protein